MVSHHSTELIKLSYVEKNGGPEQILIDGINNKKTSNCSGLLAHIVDYFQNFQITTSPKSKISTNFLSKESDKKSLEQKNNKNRF